MANQYDRDKIKETIKEMFSKTPKKQENLSWLTNISKGEAAALLRIYFSEGKESLSPSDISSMCGFSPARATTIIGNMEAKKLIKRTTTKEDLRSKKVTLTEAGQAECERLVTNIDKKLDLLIDGLGTERIVAFLETLEMACKIMEEEKC